MATPLEGAQKHLIGTLQHSVLGERWVYDAAGDPLALGCYARALAGQQEQADLEIYDGDTRVEVRDQTIRLILTRPSGEPDVRLAQVVDEVVGAAQTDRHLGRGRGAVAAG